MKAASSSVRRAWPTRFVFTALFALSFGAPRVAGAYCRMTTCDPEVRCIDDPEACCVPDENGCDTNGLPLSWPSTCVSYSVQGDGSREEEIDAGDFGDSIARAFSLWQSVRCEGGTPSIRIEDFGPVTCARQEYNSGGGNANIWLFQDAYWRHQSPSGPLGDEVDANAIAVTTVSFNWKTGEIYDADVEFNSVHMDFSLDADGTLLLDLPSIVTHEAGHFLGLDHTRQAGATMVPWYSAGSVEPRSIEIDDERAICAVYPPDREVESDSCEPRHGFSASCSGGCSTSSRGVSEPGGNGWLALGCGLALGVLALARSRARVKRASAR